MGLPATTRVGYWRRTRALTALLLCVWLVVTFVASYYARELGTLTLFGFPLGFYMAAQGALLVYLLIVGVYAFYMNRLDRRCGVTDDD